MDIIPECWKVILENYTGESYVGRHMVCSVSSTLRGSSFAASVHRGFFKNIYQKIKIQK